MVDAITRLDNTHPLPGNAFQYNYTILDLTKDDILDIELVKENVQFSLITNLKTSPDMETFRKNRVTLVYKYNGVNNEFLFRIVLSPADYSVSEDDENINDEFIQEQKIRTISL